jgi:hypothetical protein
MAENKNHPNTELAALHLSDDAIDVLKAGKYNHRLLSEILCHKDFQRMMLDAEIYVDRIADMRVNDMNAMLEAVRQMLLAKQADNQEDLYLRTLELAQVQEDEYFGHVVSCDLTDILRVCSAGLFRSFYSALETEMPSASSRPGLCLSRKPTDHSPPKAMSLWPLKSSKSFASVQRVRSAGLP